MRNSQKLIVIGALFAIALAILAFAWQPHRALSEKQAINSGHSVTLNWQPTAGAKFYCVYRSTVSGSRYEKIGTSPSPTYKDWPVSGGTTFYYAVTAVNDKGESHYSNEIKAVVR